MSFSQRLTVPFTTDASGDATVYSDVVTGKIHAIRYVYDDADTGADFTITTDATGQTVLTVTNAGTSSVQWEPRTNIDDTSAASVGAEYTEIVAVEERIKIVVADGGNAKSGTLEIIVT